MKPYFDEYAQWHEHLKTMREGLRYGTIASIDDVADIDIAVDYAIDKLHEIGYMTTTAEMISHMVKALTDVEY